MAGLLAAVAILLVVVAGGSTVATLRLRSALADSEAHRRDAVDARTKTERQRWEATFEQAKANRLSHRPGQRFRTLELLRQCAADARTLDLPPERRAEPRDAVIATLAMPDLYFEEVAAFATDERADFDGNLEQVALTNARGDCSIRRAADDVETFHIAGNGLNTTPVFGHTGRYLALVRPDGATELWARGESAWMRRLTLAGVRNVCFRRDDRLVGVSYGNGRLEVYELPSGNRKYTHAPDKIGDGLRVDFHPTEPVVACASYFLTVIQVRDLRTGKVLAGMRPEPVQPDLAPGRPSADRPGRRGGPNPGAGVGPGDPVAAGGADSGRRDQRHPGRAEPGGHPAGRHRVERDHAAVRLRGGPAAVRGPVSLAEHPPAVQPGRGGAGRRGRATGG